MTYIGKPSKFIRLLLFLLLYALGLASAQGTVLEQQSFSSEALGRDLIYSIYLPPDYEQSQDAYPVVYMLHAHDGGEDFFIGCCRIDAIADRLIEEKRIPPLIIVMPAGGNSWFVDSEAFGNIATAFAEDLIAHIDSTYRTVPTREARAIGGISMGGYGAAHLAFTRPELFSAAAVISAAMWSEGPPEDWQADFPAFGEPFNRARWDESNPFNLISNVRAHDRRLPVFITIGDDDDLPGFLENAMNFYVALRDAGIPAELRVIDGGHTEEVWQAALEPTLLFFAEEFRHLVSEQPAGLSAQTSYATITDLGLLPGYTTSNAHALNDEGHVTVNLENHDPTRAYLWRDGELTDLGTLGGNETFATEINNLDQVVGYSLTADGKQHAFLWQDGTMTDLGTLGGSETEAMSINASGQVVGWGHTDTGEQHAFLWEDGTMTDLGTFGGVSSRANSINDAGQITGEFVDAEGNRHAFLWEDGRMRELSTLPGFAEGIGRRINRLGQVTGWAVKEKVIGPRHVVMWYGDTVTDLGTLGDEQQAIGFSINDAGLVTGRADNPYPGVEHAALLYHNGAIIDLNTLVDQSPGWLLYEAADINNRGQIVGHGLFRGEVRAFLLTLPASITGGEGQTGGGN